MISKIYHRNIIWDGLFICFLTLTYCSSLSGSKSKTASKVAFKRGNEFLLIEVFYTKIKFKTCQLVELFQEEAHKKCCDKQKVIDSEIKMV